MKRLFYLIICLVLFSCAKQEDVVVEAPKMVFQNPYVDFGVIHNVAMDSIRNSQVTIENLVEFSDNFVESHFGQENNDLAKDVCRKISVDAKNVALKYESCLTTRAIDMITDSLVNTLPINYRSYVSEIFDIVDKRLSDSMLIDKEFSAFDEKIAMSDLAYEEKQDIWMISAIAKASYEYNKYEICTRGVNGTSIAKADVGGAITGIVSWRFFVKATCTGLMFGPGGIVMTAVREAVRGAIVGSGTHIVFGGRL